MDDDRPEAFADEQLRRVLDDARAEQAAGERSRLRWLRQQAQDSARLRGVLRNAVEQRAPLIVEVSDGSRHSGHAARLGRDVLVLQAADGGQVAVAVPAIAAVSPLNDGELADVPTQDVDEDPLRLVDLLAGWAAEGALVQLRSGAPPRTAQLRSVGIDVVVVGAPGSGALTYVPLASIVSVSSASSSPSPPPVTG